MAMAPPIETILAGFSNPVIPRETSEPTYVTIDVIHRRIRKSAAYVLNTFDGGNRGLLGVAMAAPTYTTLARTAFDALLISMLTYALPVPAPSEAILQAEVFSHVEKLCIGKEYTNVAMALKQQLINAYKTMYLCTICDCYVGFANITLMEIFKNLYQTYNAITPTDRADNHDRMRQLYDPSQPIKNLFQQIEDGVDVAQAGNAPFTNA